ncbi:hypothetical protein D2E76_26420 [Mycobacteroides abscessus]|uniref:Alanine and proline rich protein n=1 Tax=Mycobacteroides abscessus TaxID=36809 RepID=A0ABD7HGW1_9MYCO|nr:hypothetical protein [Mycobacteroides abscessus]RIT28909.1 hypothetical protein D2E76_26420 [Mycobacteroides abscessus]
MSNALWAEPGDPHSIYPSPRADHPQSLYPNEPYYVRPDPPLNARMEPGGVRARDVQAEGTAFEQAYAVFENVQKEFGKHLEATQKNEHLYSRDGFNQQIDLFQETPAAKAIDRAVEQVEARLVQATKDVESIRRSLSPNGDVAAESRASRFWHRSERLLDSTKDKFNTAQELVRNASDEELGTLLQELPAYLKSVGVTTEWLDQAIRQKAPEYSKAKDRLKRAEAAALIVKSNAEMTRRALRERRPVSTVVKHSDSYDPDK